MVDWRSSSGTSVRSWHSAMEAGRSDRRHVCSRRLLLVDIRRRLLLLHARRRLLLLLWRQLLGRLGRRRLRQLEVEASGAGSSSWRWHCGRLRRRRGTEAQGREVARRNGARDGALHRHRRLRLDRLEVRQRRLLLLLLVRRAWRRSSHGMRCAVDGAQVTVDGARAVVVE